MAKGKRKRNALTGEDGIDLFAPESEATETEAAFADPGEDGTAETMPEKAGGKPKKHRSEKKKEKPKRGLFDIMTPFDEDADEAAEAEDEAGEAEDADKPKKAKKAAPGAKPDGKKKKKKSGGKGKLQKGGGGKTQLARLWDKLKRFWSAFFEPVEIEIDDDELRLFDESDDEAAAHLFEDDEVVFSDEEDIEAVDRLTWDDGEPVVENPYALTDGEEPKEHAEAREGAEDAAETGEAPLEDTGEIRLFDDAPYGPRRSSGRTRIFRTGSGTAARIHINETETTRSVEAAARRQRMREAEERRAEYVRKQKQKQKRIKALKKLFGNAAFVMFLIAAVVVALYYTFLLSDVIVSGNETYTDADIVKLSGLTLGKHMLLCDLNAARAGISEDPYLQVDSITYIFPSRIRINITERKEVASIIGLNYSVVIDHSGYVLSMIGGTSQSTLLQVTGVSVTGFQIGERLGESDDFGTATLITMIQKLEEYGLLDDMAAIDLTTPLAITLTAKNGLNIHVGQPTDLDAKLLSLRHELPQFNAQNINWGTLYLSAKGGTVYSPVDKATEVTQPTDPENPTDPLDPTATPAPGASPIPATPSPVPGHTAPGGQDPFQG